MSEFKIFGGSAIDKPENKAGRDRLIYDLNTKTIKIAYDRLQKYLTNKEIKEILTKFPTRISKVPIPVKNKLMDMNNSGYIPSFTGEDVLEFIEENYKEGQSRYVNRTRWSKFLRDYKGKFGKEFGPAALKNPEFLEDFKGENGILSIINSFLRSKFGLNDKYAIISNNSKRMELLRKGFLNTAYDKTKEKAIITLNELQELFKFALNRFNEMRTSIPNAAKLPREEYERMVLLGMYSHVNAFRDDLGNVILLPQKGLSLDIHKENIYDLTKHRLYLRSYKTDKSHGELKYEIPKMISEIIDEMVALYPYKKLLIGVELSDVKSRGYELTSYIKKISNLSGMKFTKPIRINIIRQAWSTAGKKMSYSEREELANKMGHSLTQAEFTYGRKVTNCI